VSIRQGGGYADRLGQPLDTACGDPVDRRLLDQRYQRQLRPFPFREEERNIASLRTLGPDQSSSKFVVRGG